MFRPSLTYLHAGLPVLARINPGNDLEALIADVGIGFVVTGDRQEELHRCAEALLASSQQRATMGERRRALAGRMFSPEAAVRRVVFGWVPAGRIGSIDA